tara:strand:- start:341 stop:769 length:429 start_codon:yes stop_codon:yes gene_type:complete
MPGTSLFGSTFTIEITQDAAAAENLRTSPIGRDAVIIAMRVDALSAIPGATTLQALKVDAAGVTTGLSAGVSFAAPVSAPQNIGGAAWTMVAGTSQWIPLQTALAIRSLVAADSLQISITANAHLKVTFLCMDLNTTVLAVT